MSLLLAIRDLAIPRVPYHVIYLYRINNVDTAHIFEFLIFYLCYHFAKRLWLR